MAVELCGLGDGVDDGRPLTAGVAACSDTASPVLPQVDGDKPARKKFKFYPLGYFHIDIAEVQTAEGKLYLFVAIDRTSKFAFAQLHEKAGKMMAASFLRDLVQAVPYTIHIVLTDSGIQFTNRACDRAAFEHIFDRVCAEHGIQHRLTKVKHPWTNGQVERMNRTIKEATVKRFHYDHHQQLRRHLASFLDAYNFARRLKTLKGLTPYEFIRKQWTDEPQRFRLNALHQMPGLNSSGGRFGHGSAPCQARYERRRAKSMMLLSRGGVNEGVT